MFQSMLRTVGVYKVYERRLRAEIGRSEAPRHIGIILDGNRRWAADHGNGPSYGHLVGADIAENLLDWCREIGIKSVTIYGLSTENLYRSPEEVSEILKIVEERLERLLHDERIYRDRVRVKAIGKVELLPETTQSILRQLEERTADFDNFYLNIAVAYGGRMEITDVLRSIASDIKDGREELQSFLEPRVGMKPSVSGGDLEMEDSAIRKGVKPRQVKTYVKRFLHQKGLRKTFRVLVNGSQLTIQELEREEEEKEEKEKEREGAKKREEEAVPKKEEAEEEGREEKEIMMKK